MVRIIDPHESAIRSLETLERATIAIHDMQVQGDAELVETRRRFAGYVPHA